MGPELGSDCRNLVVPLVVTQGHLFGFVWSFSFNPRRCCISQVPDLSLSTSFCLLLKRFHFNHLPVIEHRDPGCPPWVLVSSSFRLSQELAPSSPAWDGQCHQISSHSHCTSQSKRVLPASPEQEDPESENPECVSLCLWIRCRLKSWKESSCTCLKYVRHLKFLKQTS